MVVGKTRKIREIREMLLIEPCCAQKHLLTLRESMGENGTLLFHGYGDLSLAELLPALLIRYCETDLMLVAPLLPDAAADAVKATMHKQRAKMTGRGNLDVIKHLTLITDLSAKRSPQASTWLAENPFGERLTLKNVQQNDTAIILPDIALCGPMNLTYGGHFTAMATKNARTIAALRDGWEKL